MKKDPNEESKLWVTVLKLVAIAAVLIGGVGLALHFAKPLDTSPPLPASDSWGISKDSPTRMGR